LIRVTITAEGLDEAISAARATKRDLQNRQQPLEQIKRIQVARWAVNFNSQGSLYGGWEALAEWTIQDRASKGFGAGPILLREGQTRAHFVQVNEQGIVDNQAITWNIGNGPPGWLLTHHFGMDNPWPNAAPIPARKLWDLDPTDTENAHRILDIYAWEVIRRYWS
jgi:hypothetical protein